MKPIQLWHSHASRQGRVVCFLASLALILGVMAGTVPITAQESISRPEDPDGLAVVTAMQEDPDFLKEEESFTIAILPDTQQETVLETAVKNEHFKNRTQWLVDNKDELNLRFVIHTGDVVNWDTPEHEQFEVASEAMRVIDDAKIPNALCLGNHDTAAVGPGGSAAVPGSTHILVRETTTFNTYFPVERYPGMVTFEPDKVDNSYRMFAAAGRKWLVLTLELWPRYEVVVWARKVVSEHPEHNVLIATHSYLTSNGTIESSNGGYGANSPKLLYDALIKIYPNIKMVFSGHTGISATRVDTGLEGNKIISILGTFHSGATNPVQLLRINPDQGVVSTRFYAPLDDDEWTEFSKTFDGMDFIKPQSPKAELAALVDSYRGYNQQAYLPETWTDFNRAYANAAAIRALADASDSQAVGAAGALTEAANRLVPQVRFADVPSHAWYFNAVSFAAARGFTNGTGPDTYHPDAELARGDCIVLLMRAYGIDADRTPAENFDDAGDSYFTGYLSAAKRLGITGGIGNNLFAPEKTITRQEMFSLLYQVLQYTEALPGGDSGKSLGDFADAPQIEPWAEQALSLFVKTGVISGDGGNLSPRDVTTRAEMAQVLFNLFSK